MTDQNRYEGPLRLPQSLLPPSIEAAKALQKLRLQAHSTAANWLPEGLWEELDSIRSELLRVREQVAAELASLDASLARFRDEDRQHEGRLRQAQRDGQPATVEDQRTPPEQRQAERKAIEERIFAGVTVLAEIADSVPKLAREREEEWLADLRARLVPAEEKRRELERQLEEAKAEAFQIHRLGLWLQQLSDDGAFGRQPYPTPEPVPAQFSEELLRTSLERPWYREQVDEPVVCWQEQSEDVKPLEREDETGVVSGLEEREGASA